jgi:hypothetical protein
MDILAVIIVLLLVLFAATWSAARSCFQTRGGQLAGMGEATRGIIRGINSHCECAGLVPPAHVTRAVEAVRLFARGGRSSASALDAKRRALLVRRESIGAAGLSSATADRRVQFDEISE